MQVDKLVLRCCADTSESSLWHTAHHSINVGDLLSRAEHDRHHAVLRDGEPLDGDTCVNRTPVLAQPVGKRFEQIAQATTWHEEL